MQGSDFGFDRKGLPVMNDWDNIYCNYGDMLNDSMSKRIQQARKIKLTDFDQNKAFFNEIGINEHEYLGNYNRNPRLKINWFNTNEANTNKANFNSTFNLTEFI